MITNIFTNISIINGNVICDELLSNDVKRSEKIIVFMIKVSSTITSENFNIISEIGCAKNLKRFIEN